MRLGYNQALSKVLGLFFCQLTCDCPTLHPSRAGSTAIYSRYPVIDGYVWLDDQGKKGLGARLYDDLDARIQLSELPKLIRNGY